MASTPRTQEQRNTIPPQPSTAKNASRHSLMPPEGRGYARSPPLLSLFRGHPRQTKRHLPLLISVFMCNPPLSFHLHPDLAEDGQQASGNEKRQKPFFLCPRGASGCTEPAHPYTGWETQSPCSAPLYPCSFQLSHQTDRSQASGALSPSLHFTPPLPLPLHTVKLGPYVQAFIWA